MVLTLAIRNVLLPFCSTFRFVPFVFFGLFCPLACGTVSLTSLCVFVLVLFVVLLVNEPARIPSSMIFYILFSCLIFYSFGIQWRFSAFFVLFPASTYCFSVTFGLLDYSFFRLFRYVPRKHLLFFCLFCVFGVLLVFWPVSFFSSQPLSVFCRFCVLDCFVLLPVGTVCISTFLFWVRFLCSVVFCYSSCVGRNGSSLVTMLQFDPQGQKLFQRTKRVKTNSAVAHGHNCERVVNRTTNLLTVLVLLSKTKTP